MKVLFEDVEPGGRFSRGRSSSWVKLARNAFGCNAVEIDGNGSAWLGSKVPVSVEHHAGKSEDALNSREALCALVEFLEKRIDDNAAAIDELLKIAPDNAAAVKQIEKRLNEI